MAYTPHMQKPDKDNLEKALLDCVFEEDSHVWDGRVSKLWGWTGAIIITNAEDFKLSEYIKERLDNGLHL